MQIRVRDEGAGIDAQLLPHVFDLFVQGDQSYDRAQGGLGIGLTVTKRLIELHGGRIEVASAGAGRGSEFTITLPQGVLAEERAPDPPAPSLAASRRILVVDDNADAATSLAVLLEMEGHEVITVRDGPAALRALDRFDAQLVLTDIGLPGIDGYALADLIRQRGGMTPHVVALSGYAVETRDAGGGAVFDAHLTKPLELARLAEVLARLPSVQRGVLSR
jgi:CheY-like chemotaxis protein